MSNSARKTCGCLLFVLFATSPAFPQTVPGQLIVRFAPGVLQPPPGQTGGAVEAFSFSSLEVRNALVNEGIEYLTRLFPRFKSEDCASKNLIGEPVLLEDLSEFYIVSLRPGTSADAEVRVGSIPGVLNAEWPRVGRLLSYDALFLKQWGLHNPGIPVCSPYNAPPPAEDADINAPEAWSIEEGDNLSVRVGILDTGIRASHQDFGGRVTSGVTFLEVAEQPPCPGTLPLCDPEETCTYGPVFTQDDDFGHGTAVAGIVAATGDNSLGVAGVAWGVTLVPIKMAACSQRPDVISCNSGRALDWARSDSIPILNMSYDSGGETALERAALRNAFYSGQLLVAAAGNDNNGFLIFPARYAKMVCAVGAYFTNGRRWRAELHEGNPAFGSCYGPAMDLAAPGGAMIATTNFGGRCRDDQYYALATCSDGFTGTSAAAPVVSGVAALLLSKYPGLLGEDLYQAMITTARWDFADTMRFDDSTGYGHVRADTALKFLAPPRVILHRRETGLSVVSVDSSLRYLEKYPGLADGFYPVGRYVMRKAITFNPPFGSTPVVWVRSSGSLGAKDTMHFNYDEEVYWGRILSVSATGCSLETVVYNIPSAPLLYQWYPIVPSPHVAVALTIVGVPEGAGGASFGEPVPQDPIRGEEALIPSSFALRQNQPNPFSASTTIRFELPVATVVRLEIFDAQGRLVRTLADGRFPAGFHGVDWDHRAEGGRHVGAGVYLYRIQAGSFRDQKKMALLAK